MKAPIKIRLRTFLLIAVIGCFLMATIVFVWNQFVPNPLEKPEPLQSDLPVARPPAEMAVFQILTGVNHRTAAFAYQGGSLSDPRDFSMTAVLVKHPRGDLLIDTGLGCNADAHFQTMPAVFRLATEFQPGACVAEQLKAAGYDQKNLRGIVLTHAHWDHVSGVPDFPNTPVLVNAKEYDFIQNGGWITELMRSFSDVKYETYAFEDRPYLGFSQSYDLYQDGSIVIVPASGHTPGSVIVFLTLTSGQRYALVGDLVWQREGIIERKERPWFQRTLADAYPAEVRKEILHMSALTQSFPEIILVPSHDPRGFETMSALSGNLKTRK